MIDNWLDPVDVLTSIKCNIRCNLIIVLRERRHKFPVGVLKACLHFVEKGPLDV